MKSNITACVVLFLLPMISYFLGGYTYTLTERRNALSQHAAYYDSQTGQFKYGFLPSQLDNICLREEAKPVKERNSKGIEIRGKAP